MNKRDFEYFALAALSFLNTIGYGTLAHTFFTKLIASADFEVMGFPFTFSSDPFIRIVVVNLGTAIATGSSIVIPAGLAWCGIHYNEYIQRLLDQMPDKPRKPKVPSNIRIFRKRKLNSELQSEVNPDSNSDGGAEPWNN